jgi:hypothetical protein
VNQINQLQVKIVIGVATDRGDRLLTAGGQAEAVPSPLITTIVCQNLPDLSSRKEDLKNATTPALRARPSAGDDELVFANRDCEALDAERGRARHNTNSGRVELDS